MSPLFTTLTKLPLNIVYDLIRIYSIVLHPFGAAIDAKITIEKPSGDQFYLNLFYPSVYPA